MDSEVAIWWILHELMRVRRTKLKRVNRVRRQHERLGKHDRSGIDAKRASRPIAIASAFCGVLNGSTMRQTPGEPPPVLC